MVVDKGLLLEDELSLKCVGEPEHPIPEEVYIRTGVTYEDAFTKADAMVEVAKAIKDLYGDVFCKLPFCVTIEAEALGSKVSFDRRFGVPTVHTYLYNSLEEVEEIAEIDFQKGRVSEVLRAAEILERQGEDVILNVEGPFTILGLLLPSRYLYKGLLKSPEKVKTICHQITTQIIRYIQEAEKRNVKMISYADPTVAYDLVSDSLYKEICGKISYDVLKRIEEETDRSLIHLCNRTSVGFQRSGFCTAEKIFTDRNKTYGEILKEVAEEGKIRFIGHGCLQQSAYKLHRGYIYQLHLKG